MTRRGFLAAGAAALAQPAAPPPNIVIVLADDLGYGDLGCYNPEARTATPRLNALAREGVRFTDAHSPSAVCTPTRYGVLTGRYCWRTPLKQGVLWGYSPCLLEPGRITIASLTRRCGYRTGGFGKWHLGLGTAEKVNYDTELTPGPFGFDEYFGIPASLDMEPYVWFRNRRVVERPTMAIAGNGVERRGPYWRGGPIAPSFKIEEVLPTIAQKAAEFIRASRTQPFLVYVALTAPHTPWVPQKRGGTPVTGGLYGEFVSQVDDAVGVIVNACDPRNTLFIFTSDNGAPWEQQDAEAAGGHRANAHWRGQKADIYEAGHRVPFLARWPGRLSAGTTSDRLVCLTDLYATIAGVLGVASNAPDSVDILASPPRGSVTHHSQLGMFALRRGPWKLIEGLGSGGFTVPKRIEGEGGQLYNLAEDPREERNLYAKEPARVREMMAELNRIRASDSPGR